MIKTRQYVSHDKVLQVETCVIEPERLLRPIGISSFDREFCDSRRTGYATENPLVPWGSRCIAHIVSAMVYGGGYDEQDWDKPHQVLFLTNCLIVRGSKWEYLRPYWEDRLSKIEGLPPQERYRRWVSPYTAYPAFDVGDTGWVHFARHFGFDGPPVVVINITSDILEGEEGHGSPSGGAPPASDPSNWIRPWLDMGRRPANGDAVLGFYVWFENFSYCWWYQQQKRTITYTWGCKGRKVPTEIWT